MNTSIVMNFNGDGRDAIQLYAEVFGLEMPKMLTYGCLPPNPGFVLSEEEKSYIYQSQIHIGGLEIMVQDLLKPMQMQYNNNITISVSTQSEGDVRKWYDAMADAGRIACPLQAMPWSKLYGAVKDKFGTSWQFQLR